MGGIFSIDSKFSQVMSRLFDLMILNFIFIVLCIPIVTIGANITAMYYVTIKMVRNEDSYVFKSYFRSFKENFKQSTIIWLIMLAIGLFLGADIYLVNNVMKGAITNIRYVFYFLILIYAFVLLYVFPSQSRFYNTIKHTFTNTLLFSIRHLPYTILILAIIIAPPVICLYAPGNVFSFYLMFIFLFGFSGITYINSIFFNKIFANYMPPDEDLEQSEDEVIAHMSELDVEQDEPDQIEQDPKDQNQN